MCEEVLFRGVLLKELKPLGRNFAIVTSAVAFGLFHGDFVQGAFAFVIGLILGFIAMEHSLMWAIALHIFNNAVLAQLGPFVVHRFGETGAMAYVLFLLVVGVVGSIIVLVRRGGGIARYLRDHRSAPGTYYGWTAWPFITLVVVNVALASYYLALALMG